MTTAALLGAGFGLGVLAIVVGLFPRRLTLAQTLAYLHPPSTPPAAPVSVPIETGWLSRVGRVGVPSLTQLGLPRTSTRADLAICDRDPGQHLAEQSALALLGFLVAPVAAVVAWLAGIDLGVSLPLWGSLLLAAAGFWLPEYQIRSQAKARRTELRTALSGMLDLVVVGLAGGAGVEQALRDAVDEPTTWGQRKLRDAIRAAHLTRTPPWTTLGQLGDATNVVALKELAAALSLAGSEGARVRVTLTARAAALRDHELSDAEAEAASATEKMSLPVVGLFAGFLVFTAYPALAAILTGL